MKNVIVTSFGYRHPEPPPPAHLMVDLRTTLRDPLHTELRHLTGLDQAVEDHVMSTPGAYATIHMLATAIGGYDGPVPQLRAGGLAVGCGGGRHRSVVIAVAVGRLLTNRGWTVTVVHRDIHLRVIV